jgi:hypothetical protein
MKLPRNMSNQVIEEISITHLERRQNIGRRTWTILQNFSDLKVQNFSDLKASD